MNTEAVTLAAAAGDRDPRTGLRAIAALRKLVDQLERAQVGSARSQGWSWAEIAKELGVTRQAAFKKHHGFCGPGHHPGRRPGGDASR